MNDLRRQELLEALRHGTSAGSVPELDELLLADLEVLQPIIDRWVFEAMDYYFEWAQHKTGCVFTDKLGPCPCGLLAAIYKRRQL